MSWRRFWSSTPDWEEALVSNYRSADRRGYGLQHLIGRRLSFPTTDQLIGEVMVFNT
jgi:hypothetical protein